MYRKVIVITYLLILPSLLFAQEQAQKISPEDEARAIEYYIKGLNAFENEEYQDALDHLNIAYLKLSESAGVNYAMADAYLGLEDYQNAEYYARTAIELDPGNKWYHLKLAQIYSRSGQYSKSIEALEKAREYHPNEIGILMQLAVLYAELREYDKSNSIYDIILSIRGSDPEVHRRKYRNHMQLNQHEAALEQLQLMLELEPDNLGTLHALGRIYTEIGEIDAAIEVLTEAKQRNPRNPETLILLAEIYVNEGEWDNLGDTFISMIEDPMLSASQKMELARFLYLQHQSSPYQNTLTRQTERVLQSFSENEPEYGEAHLLSAEFYLNQGNRAEAVKKLKLANEVMPEESEAWRQRLQLLFSEGEYDNVIQIGIEASGYVEDDASIHFFIGASYMLTDHYAEAAEWLENASLMPSRRNFRSIIHGVLGDVYTELDQWNDAVESYENALRLDNSNHNAMNNYAYYMSVREENLEYAKELALRAISYEPGNAAYLDTVGWVYFKLGEYEIAKEYIKSSIETGEASAEVYEHMGDVYSKLGKTSEAVNWWKKALEADPERSYLEERIKTQ
jgi:tetratricopeptide (TPR) repeat protein